MMIDAEVIERWMRDANPIPTLDDVDPDELTHAVAAVHTRRAAIMQTSTQHTTPTTASPQRRRKLWAFAAAFILVLAAVGAAALVIRSNAPVADEPTDVESLTWSRVPHDDAVFGPRERRGVMESVAAGRPGFVAVGWREVNADVVETTAGSESWAAVWTSLDGYTWSLVPHDPNVFGIVNDGRNWEVHGVAKAGPGLVAVGTQEADWSMPNDDEPRWLRTVERAALVWTSPDGTTWTRVPHDPFLDGGRMWDVIAGGPGVVAVGSASGWQPPDADVNSAKVDYETAAVWTSHDGITWSRADVPIDDAWVGDGHDDEENQSSTILGVTVGGPGLVAVGRYQWSAAVWTSPDGQTWTRIPHDETVFGGPGIQSMSSVTTGGPGLVAVGDDHGRGAVWTSHDGNTWTRLPHEATVFGDEPPEYEPQDAWDVRDDEHTIRDVVDTGSGLVAVGRVVDLPKAAVWTSPDGITWSRVTDDEAVFDRGSQEPAHHDPTSGMAINGVAADGPRLVAVGGDSLAIVPAAWVGEP